MPVPGLYPHPDHAEQCQQALAPLSRWLCRGTQPGALREKGVDPMPPSAVITYPVLLPWTMPTHIRMLVVACYDRPVRVRAIREWPTWMLCAAWPDASRRPACAWLVEVQYTRGRRPPLGSMLTILLRDGCLLVLGEPPTSSPLTTHP